MDKQILLVTTTLLEEIRSAITYLLATEFPYRLREGNEPRHAHELTQRVLDMYGVTPMVLFIGEGPTAMVGIDYKGITETLGKFFRGDKELHFGKPTGVGAKSYAQAMLTEEVWVIRSTEAVDDEDETPLYWCNDQGWVDRDSATEFSRSEKELYSGMVGPKDSEWVLL